MECLMAWMRLRVFDSVGLGDTQKTPQKSFVCLHVRACTCACLYYFLNMWELLCFLSARIALGPSPRKTGFLTWFSSRWSGAEEQGRNHWSGQKWKMGVLVKWSYIRTGQRTKVRPQLSWPRVYYWVLKWDPWNALSDEGSNWSSGLENRAESAGGDQLALSTDARKGKNWRVKQMLAEAIGVTTLFFPRVAFF